MSANFGHEDESAAGSNPYADPEDSELVAKAKQTAVQSLDYKYTEKDVILYNLGIGATEKELQWTFEGDNDFAALPTFGVIPQFASMFTLPLDWLPNFNPVSVLN
jgi:multifunctional beta-oxidation protein